MGNRFLDERIDKAHGKWTHTWGNIPGKGRFWKRCLWKARRRYAKQLLRHGRGNEPVHYESTVNWKDW